MASIMLASNSELMNRLTKVNKQYSKVNISDYEKDYLKDVQEQIDKELMVRDNGLSYLSCPYNDKGVCTKLGTKCVTNTDGEAFKLCLRYRSDFVNIKYRRLEELKMN